MKPWEVPVNPHTVGKSAEGHSCEACLIKRLHTPEETKEFHPNAGHGYTPETGWTGGLKPEEKTA